MTSLNSFYAQAAAVANPDQRRWALGAAYRIGEYVSFGYSFAAARALVLAAPQYANGLVAAGLDAEYSLVDDVGGTTVIKDTFSNIASGTNLTNHAGEVGVGYIQHPALVTRSFAFDSQGRLYPNGTSSTAQWYALPGVPGPNYKVVGVFDVLTAPNGEAPGVAARQHPTANTMLIARYVPGTATVELIEIVNGVSTVLGSAVVTAWAAGQSHSVACRPIGNTASALHDGVVVVADKTTVLLNADYAAIRMSGGTASGASTGIHLTDFEVTVFGGASIPNREPAPITAPAVARQPIGRVNQRNQLNNSSDSTCTYNGNQYAVWVDEQRNPIVGKRVLPNGDWQTFDLSTVAGNPLVMPTKEDSHNTYSIAVSGDGRVHVSGNHHDVALRYVRSSNPEDISAWTAADAPAGWPSSVTYPDFTLLSNGDLLLVMRGGISGNGDYRVARYDRTAQSWGAVTTFLSGSGTPPADTFSPYITTLVESPAGDGWVHAFWHWRKGTAGAGATGNDAGDLCHAKTNDGGVTWRDMAGNALTLPIDVSTSPLVLDTAASGSGLFIGPSTDVDTLGRPHCGFLLYDAGGKTQAMHAWHDGSAWHVDQVTAWGYRLDLTVGVVDSVIARPQVLCPPDGSTWMLVRHNADVSAQNGKFHLVDITPGRASLGKFELWGSHAYYCEVHSFDRAALRARGELYVMVAPAAPVALTNPDMLVMRWQSVAGYVLGCRVDNFTALPPAT